jgi:hypothetical protein
MVRSYDKHERSTLNFALLELPLRRGACAPLF